MSEGVFCLSVILLRRLARFPYAKEHIMPIKLPRVECSTAREVVAANDNSGEASTKTDRGEPDDDQRIYPTDAARNQSATWHEHTIRLAR